MATDRMVVDTGIFIEHLRAANKFKTTLAQLPADSDRFISAVTLYELHMGATSESKANDVALLLKDLPVLPFTDEVAFKAAEIYHDLRRRNKMIGFRDIFIAATALFYDLPVKTINRKDFERIEGLTLL